MIVHGASVNEHLRRFLTANLLVFLAAIATACGTESSPTAPASPLAATSTPFPTAIATAVPGDTPSPTATKVATVRPTATSAPAAMLIPTPAPTLSSPSPPKVALADVAFSHLIDLVEDLGPRESATEEELEAAEYLASRLEGFGYTVHLQNFTIQRLSSELSSFQIDAPQPQVIDVIPLSRSATGEVSGELVYVGLAR